MDKHTEISDLLRDFMENHGKRRSDADRDADQIAGSDNQTIYQIMHHISDEIHESEGMRMLLGDRHMAMIPADDFFRDQAEKYSPEYP